MPTGAVLNALNIRLDPETIAFIVRHGGAKVLVRPGFCTCLSRAASQPERNWIDPRNASNSGSVRTAPFFGQI